MSNNMNNISSQLKYQRREKKAIPDNEKDEKYYERRKRNNEAAKKSRDARRIREDYIELRVKILESENEILQRRIVLLCQQIDSLHAFILEMQRQIIDKFNMNYWNGENLMQTTTTTTSLHPSQLLCIRNYNGTVDSHSTIVENTSTAINGVTALSTLMSRLSSFIQTPKQSTI